MAKTKKPENIEEAVVVEETTNALTVAENIAQNLPIIPDAFFIDGEEYSIPRVKDMEKEAEALLKKATPETYNSSAIWEEVKNLKNRLVKMRTTPDNKRKELSRPFQDFVKEIKSKTDAVGNAAKEVQDKLDDALTAKENHEAEIARQEAEAKARRTEGRKESLRALGGSYDVDSGKFSFGYTPEVVADMQIMEYDDPSWSNQYASIKEAYDKEQERLQKIKEQEETEKAEALKAAEAANEKILKLRKRILELSGFVFNEGLQSFVRGDRALHVISVVGFSDEDFDAVIDGTEEIIQGPAIPSAPSVNTESQEAPKADYPKIDIQPAPADPLGQAIAGMTGHVTSDQDSVVAEPDGAVRVSLVFYPEKPYLDIPLNRTFVRLYPDELESEAMSNIPQDKIKAVRRTEDGALTIKVIDF